MTFFDIAHWVLMGGAISAALVAVGSVAYAMRDRPQRAKGDCKDTALILHGEGVRRDC
ncbi:MAG: hypothetical protein IT464_10600 [Planctomycetes bacterium]|nr:hypothetical protein [Planctomycetota bacterium]